jgi:hypothetical protein
MVCVPDRKIKKAFCSSAAVGQLKIRIKTLPFGNIETVRHDMPVPVKADFGFLFLTVAVWISTARVE